MILLSGLPRSNCGNWYTVRMNLIDAARAVIENWETGDLAEAVRELDRVITQEQLRIDEERGNTVEEIWNTLVYVGEQVENLRLVQERLIEALSDLVKEKKQKGLF